MPHCALILLEGETEDEFFREIASIYLGGTTKKFKNLKGNYNINNKIIDKVRQFSDDHPQQTFDVYICVDRERAGAPIYNELYVSSELARIATCKNRYDVIAELMIESLFFIDIDGIYDFLRMPNAKRNNAKYRNYRSLTHNDLTALFKQQKKHYHKGHKCESFVKALDLKKIITEAEELTFFIGTIKDRHKELNT